MTPTRPYMKNKILGIASLTFLLFVTVIMLIWQHEQRSKEIKVSIQSAYKNSSRLDNILVMISQAESLSRAYLFSLKPEYLTASRDLNARIQPEIEDIISLNRDSLQNRNLSRLNLLLGKKIQFLEAMIGKAKDNPVDASEMITSLRGKILMDAINQQFSITRARESEIKDIRLGELESMEKNWDLILLVGGLGFLGLIIFLLNLANRDFNEMKRLETFLKFMVDSNADAFMIIDRNDRIVSLNKTAIKFFSLSTGSEPKVGDDSRKVIPPGFEELILEKSELAKAGERSSQTIDFNFENQTFWFRILFYPIYFGSRVSYVNIVVRDITQAKVHEDQLQQYKIRTQAMLESSNEGFYLVDLGGRIELLNEKARDIIYEIYGRSVKIGDRMEDLFYSDAKRRYFLAFNDAKEGRRTTLDVAAPVANDTRWYHIIFSPVYNGENLITGVSAIVVDITEKKKIEKAIMRSESTLRALIDSMPDAFYMIDRHNTVLVMNEPARDNISKVFGQDLQPGKNYINLFPEESQDRVRENLARCFSGETFELTRSYELGSETIWLKVKYAPVYNKYHKIFAAGIIITNVTEAQEYQANLQEARRIAENAERLQQQFLANMSHEIRTPLNGILGMTGLMEQTELNPVQKHYMNMIRYSSDNLMVLINDVLDLSKIKAGKFLIEKKPFNIYDLLKDASGTFEIRAREKGLRFSVMVNPYMPPVISGDPHRLVQVLNNLLGNALKFTDNGYIWLQVSLAEQRDNALTLEFHVKDSGIGIAPEQLNRIFEAFEQEENTISKQYGGTGLGLTITRHLVEMQGGTITADSIKGKETSFRVRLPFEITRENINLETVVTGRREEPQGELRFPGKRVLVFEDNEINLEILSLNLKRYEVGVETAADGIIGIDILKKDRNFDLVLLDIRMPRLDGFEVLRIMRSELQLTIPVIVLTASVLQNEKGKCIELGANDYMSKPFTRKQLETTLTNYLGPTEETPIQPNNVATQGTNFHKNGDAALKTIDMPQPSGEEHTIIQPAPSPESLLKIEELPNFTFDNLMILDNKQTVRKLIEQYRETVPATLEELQLLAVISDWQAIAKKVHKLKSTLSIIYIEDLYSILSEIELNIKEEKKYDNIPELIERALSIIRSWLPFMEEKISRELELV